MSRLKKSPEGDVRQKKALYLVTSLFVRTFLKQRK